MRQDLSSPLVKLLGMQVSRAFDAKKNAGKDATFACLETPDNFMSRVLLDVAKLLASRLIEARY